MLSRSLSGKVDTALHYPPCTQTSKPFLRELMICQLCWQVPENAKQPEPPFCKVLGDLHILMSWDEELSYKYNTCTDTHTYHNSQSQPVL